jgi:hypothetical protein
MTNTTTGRSMVCVALAVSALLALPAGAAELPAGWVASGKAPKDYTMGVEPAGLNGKPSAFIRARVPKPSGFSTLMQMIVADDYQGKRVRLTAQVRSVGVEDWAGLWMRVDGKEGATAFDNMQRRPIKGITPYTEYQVVLDVGADSEAIAFGLLLDGPGTVWMTGLRFEIVDKNVPVTEVNLRNDKPKNLDFAQ